MVLESTYSLISERKFSRAKRYLNKLDGKSSDFYLASTLYNISISNYYDEAISFLKINDEDYPIIKQLIGIGLKYELAKANISI